MRLIYYIFCKAMSNPLFPPENSQSDDRYSRHNAHPDPIGIRVVAKGYAGAHGQGIGYDHHWKHDPVEYREHFHGAVELVCEQGVVGAFKRFDSLFGVFEGGPDTNVRADEI